MESTLQIVETFFNGAWDFLSSVEFPGLDIPVLSVLLGVAMVGISFRILALLLGTGVALGSVGKFKQSVKDYNTRTKKK